MNFKNALLATALVGTAALTATSVMAQPFSITVDGLWTSVNPVPSNFSHTTPAPTTQVAPIAAPPFPPNGTTVGSDQINWGNPFIDPVLNPDGLNSGYRIVPINQTGITDLTDPAGFVIGQFTHINFPITGDVITSANLQLTLSISDNGGLPATPVFNFTFLHNETDNFPGTVGVDTCPATGGLIPPEGCPDVVTLQSAFGDTTVDIGGVQKTLHILGFLLDANDDGIPDNNTLLTQFVTTEQQDNHALLLVTFSNPPLLPEPASIGLLGLGVLGLGWMGYRRRKAETA